jgi:hypothetical protein
MNAGLAAITISLLLFSLFLYFVINGIKNLLNSITITRSPSPAPAPAPAPSPSVSPVTITSDGIQFPKPSSTEGYISNSNTATECDPDYYENSLQIEPNETPGAFLSRKNEFLQSKIGWCTLAGITDPKGFAVAYNYHDGDYNAPVWDFDTKKCIFSGDDTPYACLYTEIKDAEGNVIKVENNEGEKLEVKFYNDYKSGKLQSYLENLGIGTAMKFLINDDGKLELHKSANNDRHTPAQKMLIKPGYNYIVTSMLLGTAIAMADNDIDMPDTGIPIKFQTLTVDEINTNMQTDVVDV